MIEDIPQDITHYIFQSFQQSITTLKRVELSTLPCGDAGRRVELTILSSSTENDMTERYAFKETHDAPT